MLISRSGALNGMIEETPTAGVAADVITIPAQSSWKKTPCFMSSSRGTMHSFCRPLALRELMRELPDSTSALLWLLAGKGALEEPPCEIGLSFSEGGLLKAAAAKIKGLADAGAVSSGFLSPRCRVVRPINNMQRLLTNREFLCRATRDAGAPP